MVGINDLGHQNLKSDKFFGQTKLQVVVIALSKHTLQVVLDIYL